MYADSSKEKKLSLQLVSGLRLWSFHSLSQKRPYDRACERGFRGCIASGPGPIGARAQGARKSSGFRVKFWYRTITP